MKTFKRNIMISLVTLITLVSSCQKPKDPFNKSGSAKLSTVNVKLPSSSAFKPSQGSAKVDSYKISVTPKDSSKCQNPTTIDQTKKFSEGLISQKFTRGCDYLVKVSLGENMIGGFSTYYENSVDKVVSSQDLEKSPVSISVQIAITDAGKNAYMPETLTADQVPVQPPVTPNPTTTLPELGGSLNGNIVSASGQEVPLSSVFTTQYLIIDFSNPGCGYCETHAREMNQDSARQKIYSGSGKCKSITGTSSNSLSSWLQIVGKSSFVGQNSYGHKQGMDAFGAMFGFPRVDSTPTFLFVDRQGTILKKSVGSDPNFDNYIDQQCK